EPHCRVDQDVDWERGIEDLLVVAEEFLLCSGDCGFVVERFWVVGSLWLWVSFWLFCHVWRVFLLLLVRLRFRRFAGFRVLWFLWFPGDPCLVSSLEVTDHPGELFDLLVDVA